MFCKEAFIYLFIVYGRVYSVKSRRLLSKCTCDAFAHRKYRPLHGQRLDFPMLSYTRRFSPFESPAPVHPGKTKADELGKDQSG